MRRGLGAAVAAFAAILLLAGGLAWYGQQVYGRPGPLVTARELVVPRGGSAQMARVLAEAGVIDSPTAFRVAATLTRPHGALRAAEFAFPEHASLRDVLAVLRTGRPVQHRLTIPEGLTAAQVAELVGQAEALAGEAPVPAEGSILPETYLYERGTARAALLDRARAAMDRALAAAWAARAPDLPLATPRDALILASIVEHETGKPEDRPHIAAVFLNRLRLGMKLQSDPTVIYGLNGGRGGLDRKLTRADLDTDGAYNTYRNAGLPPGPIDSPGLAALHAVMQPIASEDLYFVADGTSGHSLFAQTLDQHERNVARYRAATGGAPVPLEAEVTEPPHPPAPPAVAARPRARR